MTARNKIPPGRWVVLLLAFIALVGFHLAFQPQQIDAAVFMYAGMSLFLLLTFYTAARGPRVPENAPPQGRICAIIPAYNEDPDRLNDCVRALLMQTRVPDVIYVVDDGSKRPVKSFGRPGVIWLRQENQGKRYAQRTALHKEQSYNPDFILTVDSDSVLDEHAVELALRALGDPETYGVTGTILVAQKNWLSKLLDLELMTWCLVGREARSYFGAVAPTSGVLGLYRSAVVYDNLDDYVVSGTCGDDRRLTHYSLLRGRVVAVSAALVESDMPTTLWRAYKQRVRWFQSYWRYVPWEISRLDGVALAFRVWNLCLTLLTPIIFFWVFIWFPWHGGKFLWQGFAFWLVLTYIQTLAYAFYRPDLPASRRWGTWAIYTLVLLPWQLFVVRPAMWHALFTCKSADWATRESQH